MKHALVSAAVGALAATLVAGGVAWATIPATGGVISGCYRVSEDDQKGQVRVVADPTSCRNNEAGISWNQVGPQGPKGDKGDQGIQGATGINGTDGRDGTNGTDGMNGTDGTNGTDGVSVTSAIEAAGANCTDGGVQLTAVNGVSYVCNGNNSTFVGAAAGGDLDGTYPNPTIRLRPSTVDPGCSTYNDRGKMWYTIASSRDFVLVCMAGGTGSQNGGAVGWFPFL